MSLSDDECERITEILAAIDEMPLRGREREFVDDIIKRYDEQGADLHLTPAQWSWLENIYSRA